MQGGFRVGGYVRRRNVRRVREHRVEGSGKFGQGGEGVPLNQVYAERLQVLTGVGDGVFGEFHREHLGVRQFALNCRRDSPGAGAQVDDAQLTGCRIGACGQHLEGFFDE